MKIIKVPLQQYSISKKPDYDLLGSIVDKAIEKEFPDGKYLVRAISIDEHIGITIDQLIRKIVELGTDKYDPNRKPVAHDDFLAYDYDIQAGSFEIKDKRIVPDAENECDTLFGTTIYNFYVNTPFDRGCAVRIDLLLFYDPKQLVQAEVTNLKQKRARPELEQFLFKFKNQTDKKSALIGLVQIER